METLISNYKTWLIANSKSMNTIESYTKHIREFLMVVQTTDIKSISEEVINQYFAVLKPRVAQATLNQHISALKSFLDYQNILIRVPKTKTPMRKNAEIVTEKDFKEVILPLAESEFTDALRVKAMLSFLYYVGLRVEDASKVKRNQFDLDNNLMIAKISKQNLEKKFIVPEVLKEILICYFAGEAEETNAFNMNVYQMEYVFKKLNSYVPELKLHPHKFRKSFATNAHILGMDPIDIQEMMGHKQLATTQIYIRKDEDRIKNKYLKLEAEKALAQKKGKKV